jgi:hypothetical protein
MLYLSYHDILEISQPLLNTHIHSRRAHTIWFFGYYVILRLVLNIESWNKCGARCDPMIVND